MVTPIFLFSLPRSGSTLLQRILATHREIATASEPWLLLPLLYTLKARGAWADYSHQGMVRAIEDFCSVLPNTKDDYRAELAELARRLYAKAAGPGVSPSYFLDKTPRYHLVAAEIVEMFPDARFILLWRNPLAVAASMIETWGAGKWNLYAYRIDLQVGLANLLDVCSRHPGKIHMVNYENLVLRPQETLADIYAYLELAPNADALEDFAGVQLSGRMGDPIGSALYERVSSAPLDKWKQVFCNPLRKAWGRRYLDWIGRDRLESMGYDWAGIRKELDDLPNSSAHLGSDAARMAYGKFWQMRDVLKWTRPDSKVSARSLAGPA